MDVDWRSPEDVAAVRGLIRRETDAKQRDRYRVVELACGGVPTKRVMAMLSRSRGFVQRWAYVYRDHGLEAVVAKKPTGRKTILPEDQHQAFKQRILDGPTQDDGVCTLRGVDAQRILEKEFGVSYQLNGVYDLLRRLNLSVLVPRPEHRKADPQAMKQWVEDAPLLSNK